MDKEKLKQTLRWQGFKSVEFRVLGLIGRAMGVLAFIVYLISTAPAAFGWMQVTVVRMQDIARLDALLQDAKAQGDFLKVGVWMSSRPLTETKDIMTRATPYYPYLSPFVFFDFSDRAARQGRTEDADLWNMIAHYRMRFDLLRCGLTGGVEEGQRLIRLLSMTNGNFQREIPDERRRTLVPQVLAFDTAHPAANDPEGLCKALSRTSRENYTVLRKDAWESYRMGMHEAAEISVKVDPSSPPPEELKKPLPAKEKKKAK